MLIQSIPRWAVWLMNIVVVAIIYLTAEAGKLAGWQFCLGYLVGFGACYVLYGCWRVDDVKEGYQRFPPEKRQARYERDQSIDPRVRDHAQADRDQDIIRALIDQHEHNHATDPRR